jgi:hypothetical protein
VNPPTGFGSKCDLLFGPVRVRKAAPSAAVGDVGQLLHARVTTPPPSETATE